MYLFKFTIISFTIFLITGIGDSNLDGSKLPCKVIFPPNILHFLVSKSTYPNAEARLLPISLRANQHPFPKKLLSMICQSFDNLIDVFPRILDNQLETTFRPKNQNLNCINLLLFL
jgi:hypothetical protein